MIHILFECRAYLDISSPAHLDGFLKPFRMETAGDHNGLGRAGGFHGAKNIFAHFFLPAFRAAVKLNRLMEYLFDLCVFQIIFRKIKFSCSLLHLFYSLQNAHRPHGFFAVQKIAVFFPHQLQAEKPSKSHNILPKREQFFSFGVLNFTVENFFRDFFRLGRDVSGTQFFPQDKRPAPKRDLGVFFKVEITGQFPVNLLKETPEVSSAPANAAAGPHPAVKIKNKFGLKMRAAEITQDFFLFLRKFFSVQGRAHGIQRKNPDQMGIIQLKCRVLQIKIEFIFGCTAQNFQEIKKIRIPAMESFPRLRQSSEVRRPDTRREFFNPGFHLLEKPIRFFA